MHLLDLITIVATGLMTGNELAIAAFVNPALRRLESGPHAQARSVLARSLGRAMPFWYGLCLALLVLGSFLHRHQANRSALVTAAAIWVVTILMSIGILVPINNRIASRNAPAPGWERDRSKWDVLHCVRVLLLIIAVLVLTNALAA